MPHSQSQVNTLGFPFTFYHMLNTLLCFFLFIRTLVDALKKKNKKPYLISGGFDCLIEPAAEALAIPMIDVFANKLKFYYDGSYAGFDKSQPTSRSGGKGRIITDLKEQFGHRVIVMIGDGVTDMEACPPADAFIGQYDAIFIMV